MGGGGFVSGVFATSQEGLYYARTDVGGAYRYNKDTQLWESMSYGISEDDQGFLGIAGLAYGDQGSEPRLPPRRNKLPQRRQDRAVYLQ